MALHWAAGDGLRDFLDLPRHMAIAIAAADLPAINQVVDVGSGPGDFLAVALERCPAAAGVWIDLSPADALAAFYTAAAAALGPGGWLANLDHILIDELWAARLRQARSELVAPNQPGHAHDRPLPTVDQHLAALTAAGFTDFDVPWRAFSTVLILAKSPTPEGGQNR